MSEVTHEKIPVDSMVIARKVMPASRTTVEDEVQSVVRATGLEGVTGVSIREVRHVSADLVTQVEYAQKKLSHPRLAVYSTVSLAESFNTQMKRDRDGMTDYVSSVTLGEVDYDCIREGEFIVGFMLSDSFRRRLSQERTDAIDTVLDITGLSPTDSFRQWRNENDRHNDSLGLAILRISTLDPCAENMLEELCGDLEQKTSTLEIDLFDAQARMTVVDLSAEDAVIS